MAAQAVNFDLFADTASLQEEKTGVLPKGFNVGDSFDDKMEATIEAIKKLLVAGKNVVVATSFGKDSSVLTMLAIRALEQVMAIHGKAPTMYVITSNTLLENPELDMFSRGEAAKVRRYAKARGLPLEMRIASPSVSNDYLVNIIGGRMIASTPDSGRQCTSMMKVEPIERMKKRIAKEAGYTPKQARDQFVTLIGKRSDESAERGRNMAANGERPDAPVKMIRDKAGKKYEWVMSPIAHYTLDDVFMGIAYVRNDMFSTYSNFDDLVEVYKAANDGACMINVYAKGKPGRTACSARTGCHICLQVGEDRSMDNMLRTPEKAYMRPLREFRDFIKRNHYRIDKRNWLSRTINADGTVNLAPNSYAPDFCLELLRYALTIDANEREAAAALGIPPRFQLLSPRQIVAIDFLWARYGYQHGMMACYTAYQVEMGKRWDLPEVDTAVQTYSRLPEFRKVTLPFADNQFGHFASGHFDVEAAATDSMDPFATPTGDEFDVDEEGAELFWAFELESVLDRYGPIDQVGSRHTHEHAPAVGVHYFLRLGTVQLFKGAQGELDRMLQMSNQIHRHGIRDILNDPVALTRVLAGGRAAMPAAGEQFDIEDLIQMEQKLQQQSVIARH